MSEGSESNKPVNGSNPLAKLQQAESHSVEPPSLISQSFEAVLPVPSATGEIPTEVDELTRQLLYYRAKAVELDVLVFEMRTLLQSGKGFSEILNLDGLLSTFMAVCRERYGVINSAVLLVDDLDPNNIFYRVRAHHGLPDHYLDPRGDREEMLMYRIPVDQGMLWQLIKQGDVFSVLDMRRLPRFGVAFRKWNLQILNSDVWVPLMRGGEVLGILTLGACEDGSQINESEFAFLQEIAAVAATNIDSTMKYEKNARILTNLQTLYDVNQQLANVNDFKQLTIETLATAVDALHAQKANLMLLNPETKKLEIKVVWGNIPAAVRDSINDGRADTKTFDIGEGVAGMAAKTRKAIRINDRAQIEQVGRNTVYCILSVPLLYGGNVMGVITLTNKVTHDEMGKAHLDLLGRYGEDDAQLLLGLADQAAVNLHKARLYNASITDRMTGLHNTRHFDTIFEDALEKARLSGEILSLAVVDIDLFKRFNDTYGHKAGDAVLTNTARLLGEYVRPESHDQAFRYGGEEFCMLLPDTSPEHAADVMEGFRALVEHAVVDFGGERLRVTVSVGIASFPKHGENSRLLFEAADRALYAAKEAGRNTVKIAPPLPPASAQAAPETSVEPAPSSSSALSSSSSS